MDVFDVNSPLPVNVSVQILTKVTYICSYGGEIESSKPRHELTLVTNLGHFGLWKTWTKHQKQWFYMIMRTPFVKTFWLQILMTETKNVVKDKHELQNREKSNFLPLFVFCVVTAFWCKERKQQIFRRNICCNLKAFGWNSKESGLYLRKKWWVRILREIKIIKTFQFFR